MAHLKRNKTFTTTPPNNNVTAKGLHDLVDLTTIDPDFIAGQPEILPQFLQPDDNILVQQSQTTTNGEGETTTTLSLGKTTLNSLFERGFNLGTAESPAGYVFANNITFSNLGGLAMKGTATAGSTTLVDLVKINKDGWYSHSTVPITIEGTLTATQKAVLAGAFTFDSTGANPKATFAGEVQINGDLIYNGINTAGPWSGVYDVLLQDKPLVSSSQAQHHADITSLASTGALCVDDDIIVPAGEKWLIQYGPMQILDNAIRKFAAVWLKDGSIIKQIVGDKTNAAQIGYDSGYNMLEAGYTFALTEGAYQIRCRIGTFGPALAGNQANWGSNVTGTITVREFTRKITKIRI